MTAPAEHGDCMVCRFVEHLQRELCTAHQQERRDRVLELEHLLRRNEADR